MVKLTNNFGMVNVAAFKAATDACEAGAEHIANKVKDKIDTRSNSPSAPGSPPHMHTGRLYKGVAKPRKSLGGLRRTIGFKAPARHAHLLEFGTAKMAPRPYFRVTFIENMHSAELIMRSEFKKSFYSATPALGV